MSLTKTFSPYQFACFRIVFGIYLTIHFAQLIPYGKELFSREGVLADSQLNFTYGIFPNLLNYFDNPFFITFFLSVLTVLALLFTVGWGRCWVSFLLWYGWACLFNRNNLINNPSLAYVGLILIFCILIPKGEPWSLSQRNKNWFFPREIFWSAWFLLAIGYTFSGYVKLFSPSWQDGSALYHLATNPLARPGLFRDLFLLLPDFVIKILTWFSLGAELLFLFLIFRPYTRLMAWILLVGIHFGILLVVDFADLTFGMLMMHFFVFDPDWFPPQREKKSKTVLLFDGVCGLCDRAMQFFMQEDNQNLLYFAPLQGKTAQEIRQRHPELSTELKTILLVENWETSQEKVYQKSEAVLRALAILGGIWRTVSWLRGMPQALRDRVYDGIARNRYRWFGKKAICELPSPETRSKLLD